MTKNAVIKYGIIGGIISSLLGTLNWIFVARSVEVGTSQMVGYLSIIISLMAIPAGMLFIRKKKEATSFSFLQAFMIGISISCVAGIIMAIHSVLFFIFQKEEFLEWQKQSMNAESLAQLESLPDYFYTPIFQGLIMFVMVMAFGFFISLFSSLLLKRS